MGGDSTKNATHLCSWTASLTPAHLKQSQGVAGRSGWKMLAFAQNKGEKGHGCSKAKGFPMDKEPVGQQLKRGKIEAVGILQFRRWRIGAQGHRDLE